MIFQRPNTFYNTVVEDPGNFEESWTEWDPYNKITYTTDSWISFWTFSSDNPTGSSLQASLTSKFKFTGDFVIVLDSNGASNWSPSTYGRSYAPLLRVRKVSDDSVIAQIGRAGQSGGGGVNGFVCSGTDASEAYYYDGYPSPFGFKIQRSSGQITVWEKSYPSSTYNWGGNAAGRVVCNSDTSTVYIDMFLQRAQSATVGSYHQNFDVLSGTWI